MKSFCILATGVFRYRAIPSRILFSICEKSNWLCGSPTPSISARRIRDVNRVVGSGEPRSGLLSPCAACSPAHRGRVSQPVASIWKNSVHHHLARDAVVAVPDILAVRVGAGYDIRPVQPYLPHQLLRNPVVSSIPCRDSGERQLPSHRRFWQRLSALFP